MIALAVLAAQYAGTLDVFDTSRLDVRGTNPPTAVTVANQPEKIELAADASTIASARLHLDNRRWDFTLSYSGSFTAPDLELEFDDVPSTYTAPVQLHSGTAAVGWHDRFVSVAVFETGSYGQLDTVFPYQSPTAQAVGTPGQPTTGQTPPAQTGMGTTAMGTPTLFQSQNVVSFVSSNTIGTVSWVAGRRTTLTLAGGYLVAGGVGHLKNGEDARLIVPEQYGPLVSASLTQTLTRVDALSTTANALLTTTAGACFPPLSPTLFCDTYSPIGQVEETFRHQLSRRESLSIGAGAGAAVEPTPTGGRELAILPVGGVVYSETLRPKGPDSLSLAAQLAPQVDIRTGLASDRIQLLAFLSRQIDPKVTLTVTAGFLRSIPFPNNDFPLTAINGAIEARWRVSPLLDILVGDQEAWQEQVGYPPPLVTSIAYVSVTVRAPTLHF